MDSWIWDIFSTSPAKLYFFTSTTAASQMSPVICETLETLMTLERPPQTAARITQPNARLCQSLSFYSRLSASGLDCDGGGVTNCQQTSIPPCRRHQQHGEARLTRATSAVTEGQRTAKRSPPFVFLKRRPTRSAHLSFTSCCGPPLHSV